MSKANKLKIDNLELVNEQVETRTLEVNGQPVNIFHIRFDKMIMCFGLFLFGKSRFVARVP